MRSREAVFSLCNSDLSDAVPWSSSQDIMAEKVIMLKCHRLNSIDMDWLRYHKNVTFLLVTLAQYSHRQACSDAM